MLQVPTVVSDNRFDNRLNGLLGLSRIRQGSKTYGLCKVFDGFSGIRILYVTGRDGGL